MWWLLTVKSLPVHHYKTDYIFWTFGIIEFIFSHLKIEFRLIKPVLGGVVGVAHLITGHEQTNTTESAIFIALMWSLLPKDLTINLFVFQVL